MKAKQITQLFRRKRYKVFFRAPKNKNYLGTCSEIDREIEIRPGQVGKDKLSCLIHEALHACCPDLVDWAVDETAESMAVFLWKLGYRELPRKPSPACGGDELAK